MQIKDPGHEYALDILDSEYPYKYLLKFVKRDHPPEKYPGNVGHHEGVTMQEVLRAVIDRCKYVNAQTSSPETQRAMYHVQLALWWFEHRNAKKKERELKATADGIELIPTCAECGHIECAECQ